MKKISFTKALTQTYSVQIVALLSGIILLKFLAGILTKDDMGVYLVIKRLASVGYPLLTLNLGVSLARYIPLAPVRSERFFNLAALVLVILVAVTGILTMLFKTEFSILLFGRADYSYILMPGLLFLYASGMQVLSLGYLRGIQDFNRMNIINALFALNALVALIVFMFEGGRSLSQYFTAYSLLHLALNALILERAMKEKGRNRAEIDREIDRSYLKYGISRIPSVFFIVGIFSLPVLYASSQIGLEAAAYVGIVISIANIYQTLGVPFNLLILPSTSDQIARSDMEGIRRNAGKVIDFFFTLPLLSIVLIILLASEVVQLWFGSKYTDVVPYLIFFAPASAFIILYSLLRGIIDGIEDYPWINIITSLSFAVLALSFFFIDYFPDASTGLIAGFGLSLIVLGLSSAAVLKKQTGITVFSRRNILSALLAFVFSLVALRLQYVLTGPGFLRILLIKMTAGGIMTLFSLWFYSRSGYLQSLFPGRFEK